jgi:hypothetical protein
VVGQETEKAGGLNRKTYMTVTAVLFLVVAVAHLLRIILGWRVEIGGLDIPFWVSWLAVLWPVRSHTSASCKGGSPMRSNTCGGEPPARATHTPQATSLALHGMTLIAQLARGH